MKPGGKKVAKTGPLPGVTRGITGFRVSENPVAYLIDTPGIMIPSIEENSEVGLKLGLIGTFTSSL